MMDYQTIDRYQSFNPYTGDVGDIYAQVLAKYGSTTADSVATAALTGDETQINAVIPGLTSGLTAAQTPTPSTLSLFGNQLATNPLAAPLSGLNNILSNSFVSFLKSPAVLFVVAIGLFFWLGGLGWARRKVANAK
jgi:hypothetical protein